MNLLKETIEAISSCGKTTDDVMWVGSKDGKYAIDWRDFERIADIDYDDGYGSQEIAKDLVVVFFGDCYLDRREYDGAEWWEFNEAPQMRPDAEIFSKLKGECGWETLDELNNPEEG